MLLCNSIPLTEFSAQGKTVCGPLTASKFSVPCQTRSQRGKFLFPNYLHTAANSGYFGAATGDISKDISPGRCEGPQGPDYDLGIWYALSAPLKDLQISPVIIANLTLVTAKAISPTHPPTQVLAALKQ